MKKLCFLTCLVISILLVTGCVNQLSANTAEGSDTFSESTDSTEPVNNLEGVVMTVKEGTVSPTGLTVVFKNITENELLFGEFYILEMKTDDGWYQVPVAFDGDYGFNSIGYILDPDSSREWSVDWEWLYGSLEKGEFRIVKDILDSNGVGRYETYYLAAEFTL
jgi:hypothetical protein